jgi:hypothetical protein
MKGNSGLVIAVISFGVGALQRDIGLRYVGTREYPGGLVQTEYAVVV